ncbi:MAG TPA: glycosyltransferase family 4 protein [Pseudolabrys sp.]|nr:glycosyltransferase family 4 protein [Pseudolabrys sp.]
MTFALVVPGDLNTPTGGYAYARRMLKELTALGRDIELIDIGNEFPRPSAATRVAVRRRLAAIPPATPIVIDGLAFGALDDVAEALGDSHRLVALVHHPLALETGLPADEAEALRRSERAALAHVRHVIATSATTARLLAAEYGVAPDAITVAPPGTDEAALAVGSSDGIVRLLSVGAVVPRKGFDVLVAALAQLPRDLPWRLALVGDRTRDDATVAALDADIARHELTDRILCTGAVSNEQLEAFYRAADVFVLASRFEGYGMAFTEALARGLPLIGTTAGAIPQTVPAGAGVLVPPDDPKALAMALGELIENPRQRRALRDAARAAATALPRWQESAKIFAAAVERVR